MRKKAKILFGILLASFVMTGCVFSEYGYYSNNLQKIIKNGATREINVSSFSGYYPALYVADIDANANGVKDDSMVISFNFNPNFFTLTEAEKLADKLETTYFPALAPYASIHGWSPNELWSLGFDGEEVVTAVQGVYVSFGFSSYLVIEVRKANPQHIPGENTRFDAYIDVNGTLVYVGSWEMQI